MTAAQVDYAAAEHAVRQHFRENMENGYSGVTLVGSNQQVPKPALEDGSGWSSADELVRSCWCRVSFLWGEANQADLNANPRVRTTCVFAVQVFCPVGHGTKLAMEIATDIVNFMRNTRLLDDSILFRAPYPTRVGPGGGWYQVNVFAPFQYDAFHRGG